MAIGKTFRWLGLAFLAFWSAAWANAGTTSTVELVQSYPVETTLQVPGVAQTAQVWLDLVNSATKTLDIEQYYINDVAGEPLDPIITAIKAAAARGVQVRFILDSAFLKSNPTEADCVENVAGIDLRQIDFSPGIMHAKYMVADGVNSYAGSANMDWLALTQIHELGLHTVDATLGAALETIFNTDWPNATEISASSSGLVTDLARAGADLQKWLSGFETGPMGLTVVASPENANPSAIPDTLDAITALLGTARTSADIQVYEYSTSPYSGKGSPWTVLDTAVRSAANRGVQIRLAVDATVMSSASKKQLESLASVKNIQVRAITIPEWSGGPLQYARLIHSKYFAIDGGSAGWIGSENWIDSYFLNTRNVGMTFQNATLGAQVEQVFDAVWTSAYGTAIN